MTVGQMELYNEGVKHHRQGRLEDAEQCYRTFLRSEPAHADCLHQLGALLVQKGGNKHYPEALGFVKAAIQLAPANARYRRSLGVVHESAQQWLAAADAFERAIEKQPTDVQSHMHLARVLKRADRDARAAEVYRTALRLRPDHPQAHYKLAGVLKSLGRHQAAAEEYREHLKLDSHNTSAAFWLACLTSDSSTTACPASLVAGLFDQYADHFDQHLVQKLQYKTPAVLMDCILHAAAAAAQHSSSHNQPHWSRCMDLGCGTGLMGPLLRQHVEHLAGVDLSQGMIDKARERGCYDELAVGELAAHLQAAQQSGVASYDILVAADVFVYIGDLQPVMAAAAAVTSDRAIMAFSTEQLKESAAAVDANSAAPAQQQSCTCSGSSGKAEATAQYQLQVTGRYAHAAEYVCQVAAGSGWKLLLLQESIIRYNAGQPIWGNLCVLQRQA